MNNIITSTSQEIETLEQAFDQFIKDKWIRDQINILQNAFKQEQDKILKSKRNKKDKDKANRLFQKLCRTISFGKLWSLTVPLNECIISIENLIYLLEFWIDLGFLPSKYLDNCDLIITFNQKPKSKDIYDKYNVKLSQKTTDEKWTTKTKNIKIQSTRWKSLNRPVRLNNPDIYKWYWDIHGALNDLYNWVFAPEWKEKSDKIASDIANTMISRNSELSWRLEQISDNALQRNLLPIWKQSLLLDMDPNIWMNFLSEEAQVVLHQQQSWKIPSIFNKTSLNKLRNKQVVFILLDKSWSTETFNSFKVLNLACNQTISMMSKVYSWNVEFIILPFEDIIFDIICSNLNWFILPSGGTHNHTAIASAIYIMKLLKWWDSIKDLNKKLKNIKEFVNNTFENIDMVESEFENIFWIDMENILDDSNTQQPIKPYTNSKYWDKWLDKVMPEFEWLKSWQFLQYHVTILTDWLPNYYDRTLHMNRLLKKLWIWYSQIVSSYSFPNIGHEIQQEIFRHLWWDSIKSHQDYMNRYKKLWDEAWWNTSIINLNEHMAHMLLSFVDLSIWINFIRGEIN